MNFVATALGLQLPTLRARDTLQEHHSACLSRRTPSTRNTSEDKIEWGCDPLDRRTWLLPDKERCDDDETASTVSDCDHSFSSYSEALGCVSFATPLVTKVHLRPCTPMAERQNLYYSEVDFRRFRMDYRQSLLRPRRTSTVTFSAHVVTHSLPTVDNKDDVFYSSSELKQ